MLSTYRHFGIQFDRSIICEQSDLQLNYVCKFSLQHILKILLNMLC